MADADPTPLVLLHPLGSNGDFFDHARLRWTDVPTWAPDLPGHGATPPLALGAGLDELSLHLVSWLDQHDLGQVDVLGVSLGGLAVQHLAARHPERVRRAVVVDAVPRYPDVMRAMWRDRAALVRRRGTRAVVDATIEMWFTDEARADAGPPITQTVRVLESTSAEGYARACDLLAGADTTDLLPGIDRPILVMCGTHDAPPFRDAVLQLEQSVPTTTTVWLPGRHAAALESTAAFADAVATFVRTPSHQEARP
ncbi:MAG: alpha/beta hydrolase [Nocardioidaceae bacterium]|nr:alpha/beta hydrolase [Nocardioidaceae bacterium]